MAGIKTKNGVLDIRSQVSRFDKEIVIVKRDENGKKTDKRVAIGSNSGAKLNWFMVSNGGEPRKQATQPELQPA